jgi:hypothetical protein
MRPNKTITAEPSYRVLPGYQASEGLLCDAWQAAKVLQLAKHISFSQYDFHYLDHDHP